MKVPAVPLSFGLSGLTLVRIAAVLCGLILSVSPPARGDENLLGYVYGAETLPRAAERQMPAPSDQDPPRQTRYSPSITAGSLTAWAG